MTRKELVKRFAKEQGLSEAKAKGLLNFAESTIITALKDGEEVPFLGVLSVVEEAERKTRKQKTEDSDHAGGKKTVKLKPSKMLLRTVSC